MIARLVAFAPHQRFVTLALALLLYALIAERRERGQGTQTNRVAGERGGDSQ